MSGIGRLGENKTLDRLTNSVHLQKLDDVVSKTNPPKFTAVDAALRPRTAFLVQLGFKRGWQTWIRRDRSRENTNLGEMWGWRS
jgi:hypothetical protein